MKNNRIILIPAALSFIIGAALGWFAVNVPLPFWYSPGFARLVAHSPVAGMIWSNAPTWVLVSVTSVFFGFFIKRYPMLFFVMFGAGFAYMPPVIYHYFNELALPGIYELIQRTIIFGLAVLSGYVSRRFAHTHARPDSVHVA